MIKDKDLKPCPFCGGKAKTEREINVTVNAGKIYNYMIQCTNSCIRIGHGYIRYHNRQTIRHWWNKRAC